MTEVELEMSARMSALEYVLEVLIANELAYQPREGTALLKKDLLSRQSWFRSELVDAEHLHALQAEMGKVLGALWNA